MASRYHSLSLLAFGFTTLLSSTALADQVVVFDETWVHTPDISDSHFYVEPTPGLLDDWISPIDYTQGSIWVYLEVHSKPTDEATRFQVCFEANPTYACTNQSPPYTEVGVYEWESTFDQLWSPAGPSVDWSQGVNRFACILKDTMNGKPSADNVGDEVAALYMPTEVRMVVTVVEAGSVYEPPSSSEDPTGGETSGDGDGGSTGGGSESTTTGAEPTSADGTGADPGSTEGTTPPPGTGTDGSGGGSVDGTSGETDGSGQGDEEAGGCGCTSGQRHGVPTGLAWVLVGLAALRRGLARRLG